MTAFEEMGVLPEIARAVAELDWTLPTDVQAEAIPLILGGGDVLMAAETGSGKTGAFCLPILQIVWETLKEFKEGKTTGRELSGGSASNTKWALSAFDRGAALAVTPDGLRCQSREQKEWHGTRATMGVYGKGKFFFEAIVADEGLCRIGWSTAQAALDLGTDPYGFGFGGTGKKSNNRNFDDYGEAFGKNDVIGACLDLDQHQISFTKNGIDMGLAFTIRHQFHNEVFFPAVVLKNAEMQFNFGNDKFKYNLPQGFVAISQAPIDNVKVNSVGRAAVKPPSLSPNAPQAIIIEPSRELADQTFEQLRKFQKYLDSPTIREVALIGGVPVKNQITELQNGVHIVVATPGRLEEMISYNHLVLDQCRFFVLDEADGLLKDRGYAALINRMHQQIPKMTSDGKRLQMIVCSATLHDFEVKKLADKLMHFPTWVDLKGEDAVPESVHHVVVPVDPKHDTLWHLLTQYIDTDGVHYQDDVQNGSHSQETLSEGVKLLKGEYCIRAIDTLKMDQAIIFCRTKLDCDNLERYMNRRGVGRPKNSYSCVCLHADRSAQERKENLEKFKKKEVKFLICTDVAARGIDVSGVPFMINVTLPDEKSNYVHRIGRVGRAERMGLAISLVSTVPEKVWYHGQWCSSRGKNCSNTKLTSEKGCCVWYNEKQYLADIEEHLGVTIQQIGTDINVPYDEFDGKVVYGQKRKEMQSGIEYHLNQTSSSLADLTALERTAQTLYLNRYFSKVK